MKNYDVTEIEKLAIGLIKTSTPVTTVSIDDYEFNKKHFGHPSFSIRTDFYPNVTSLIISIKSLSEVFSKSRSVLLFLITSVDYNITMDELLQIIKSIQSVLSKDTRLICGINRTAEAGNISTVAIVWE